MLSVKGYTYSIAAPEPSLISVNVINIIHINDLLHDD